MVEVIAGAFAGGGSSNNACKRHLREMLTIENKKYKLGREEPSLVFSFSDDDY